MSTQSQFYTYNPEKRNVFVQTHSGRGNQILGFISGAVMLLGSQASSLVEVFLRKNFGERYITLSQSIILFILIPPLFCMEFHSYGIRLDEEQAIPLFLFMCLYMWKSIQHRKEISKYGTAYDFKRFSLSDGELAPFWGNIIGKKWRKRTIAEYHIRIVFEPAIPILIGIILFIFPWTAVLGKLLVVSGFLFSARNFMKFFIARNWILDIIDKQICAEATHDIFMERKPSKETKGVYLPIELPDDEETRKTLFSIANESYSTGHDIWVNDFLDEEEKPED